MCTRISSSQISPCICTLLKHTTQICSINRAIWLMRPIHPTRFNLCQCNHSLLLDWQLRFTIWITRVLQCLSTFTKTNFSDKYHHQYLCLLICALMHLFSSVFTNYSLPCNGLNCILIFKVLHFEVWTQCLHQFIQTIQCTGCNPMGQQYLFAFLQINYSLTFATIQTGCSPSRHLPSNNGSLNFFPASSALSFVPISIIQPCANLQLASADENCKSL